MHYLDRTFCASPNCKNECGRKMTEEQRNRRPENMPVSYAYFCDALGEKISTTKGDLNASFNETTR
jgi:hypothetical protein